MAAEGPLARCTRLSRAIEEARPTGDFNRWADFRAPPDFTITCGRSRAHRFLLLISQLAPLSYSTARTSARPLRPNGHPARGDQARSSPEKERVPLRFSDGLFVMSQNRFIGRKTIRQQFGPGRPSCGQTENILMTCNRRQPSISMYNLASGGQPALARKTAG